MSYEGYEMHLCARGHYQTRDAYDYGVENSCDCGAPIVWQYGVDQTNDAGVKPVLVEHEPAKVETCPHCGHAKEIEEERYCIPLNAGRITGKAEVPIVEVRFKDLDSGEMSPKDFASVNTLP